MAGRAPRGHWGRVGTTGPIVDVLTNVIHQLGSAAGAPLHLPHEAPNGRAARSNWFPASDDDFCLTIRGYVPDRTILEDSYRFPDVIREQ